MKKKLKILLPIVLVLCFLALFFIFLSFQDDKSFTREKLETFSTNAEKFRVDEKLQKLFVHEGDKETWLEDLPTIHGYPIYLREKSILKMKPGLTGSVELYTFLYFDNREKAAPITFNLELYRDEAAPGKSKEIKIAHKRAKHYAQPYFQTIELQKDDTLVFKFTGKGVAFLSRPILYKKKAAGERKNVFLVAVDTLRWDQVGAKVNGIPLTPHIDAFKKDCLVFDHAFAQCPWTIPSFMSLFTGLYEYRHRVDVQRPLDTNIPALMETLSQRFISFGFHSGMGLRKRWGYSRGFDYYHKVPFTSPLFPKAGQILFRNAIKLLEEAAFPDFFFFLHTYQVHDPYTPPLAYLKMLDEQPRYKKLDAVNQNKPWKTFVPVDDELKHAYKELYQAEIHAFDAYFGEFIQKLKEMDLYRNSMIIFMSDHGEEFFEHQGWTHSHSLYNELIKVPLLVKFPGAEYADTSIQDPVAVIDILPTIMGYYQVKWSPSRIDGVDLMPLLRGDRGAIAKERPYIVSSVTESRYIREIPPKIALITNDYKIVYNEKYSATDLDYFKPYALPPTTSPVEIYNFRDDPGDRKNLVAEKAGLVKKMIPIIIDIKKIIRKNSDNQKGEKVLDKEVEEQLKSLGYISTGDK